MTAGRLRGVPTYYPVNSPVRLETEDGRRFEIVSWHADGPEPVDGRPSGGCELVFVLKEVVKHGD